MKFKMCQVATSICAKHTAIISTHTKIIDKTSTNAPKDVQLYKHYDLATVQKIASYIQ